MKNYKLNKPRMFSDVSDGIALIVDSQTGVYYGLDTLGTILFDNIINGISSEKILAYLKNLKNSPQDIELRYREFINNLLDKKILIKGTPENKIDEMHIDNGVIQSYDLTIHEYTDAQDMLLADPIHEIDKETGWTPEKESIAYTKEETLQREKKVAK